ncbi:hypothetical protein [Thalassobacillus sp. CUG 92003]|uniref:hypothetical protein n=1 Tax=Thalassobacillus sp. CUG 92003 TaxID=2736641 RepID=UPI0015E67BCD|nr:hypothetical protein [Thalassobacillus sp. CUG 92003]
MELRVVTHSGEETYVTVDDFNPKAFAELLNDSTVHVVELGGEIFARIDVKRVHPQKEANGDG